jgi:hypothetical protein
MMMAMALVIAGQWVADSDRASDTSAYLEAARRSGLASYAAEPHLRPSSGPKLVRPPHTRVAGVRTASLHGFVRVSPGQGTAPQTCAAWSWSPYAARPHNRSPTTSPASAPSAAPPDDGSPGYRIGRQYLRALDVPLRGRQLTVRFDPNSIQTIEIDNAQT